MRLRDILTNERLPINREGASVAKYLDKHYKKYLSDLEKLISERSDGFEDRLYNSIEEKLSTIRDICITINGVISKYNTGFMHEAFLDFNTLMNSIENDLYIINFPMDFPTPSRIYRIRGVSSKIVDFKRKHLFHIPFNSSNFIKPYRYSIAGFPCMYLSTTMAMCWFECEMPPRFYISEFQYAEVEKVKLINLSIKPYNFYNDALFDYRYNFSRLTQNQIDYTEDILVRYLITYPLLIACSLVALRKDAFIPEYMIPQMLLLWIRKNANYRGVAYFSCSSNLMANYINGYNIVLPAQSEDKNGFCGSLSKEFKVSLPKYISIYDMIAKYSNKIDSLKKYTKETNNLYVNDHRINPCSHTLRSIVGICFALLDIINILSSEDKGTCKSHALEFEAIYLFSANIIDNTDYYVKCALDQNKHKEMTDEELKVLITNVLTEFKSHVYDFMRDDLKSIFDYIDIKITDLTDFEFIESV